ncbi:uncharacterized protein LOC141985864 [Natator depressus]|uniref:uncharacterized protein LOC141985864 n=1 Tax=Natator depressus TaxID=27790 RepID=UPI003EBFC842
MPTPRTRRSPAWSNVELLDLIIVWGEEAVQSQLHSSCRNYDTYGQISQCMIERGQDQDTLQCRVKVKELRNAYHKARGRQTAALVLCPLTAGSTKSWAQYSVATPTSTVKTTVDTSVACIPVESGQSQEEEILHEDVEGDPEAEDDSEVREACSQKLFSTPEAASQSQLSDVGEAQTGEEAPKMTLGAQPPSLLAAAERLCRIRKWSRRTKEDFLCDVMMHSAAKKKELKEWRDSEKRD